MSEQQSFSFPKLGFYSLVAALFITGGLQCYLRHHHYSVPWLANETKQVWDVEAKIEFQGLDKPAKVSLSAPETQQGFTLTSSSSSSPGYGLSYTDTKSGKRAEWNTRKATGDQTIYFKAQFLADSNARFDQAKEPKPSRQPILEGSVKVAVETIIQGVTARSSDNLSFSRELIKTINNTDNQNTSFILKDLPKSEALELITSYAHIPSRLVGVVRLEDGRRRREPVEMIEVWQDGLWRLLSIESDNALPREELLVWDKSGISLLDVTGGKHSRVSFSILSREISPNEASIDKANAEGLLNFSIHSLPLAEQSMFKTILLIPMGALIVVFLRIIVGLKTSGTFMPVLIAVTFVQTELINGIIGFVLIVGVGLLIRSYLSKLNLLLVARISAVIVVVILMVSFFTIIAYKMGLTEVLTITFFPMIILSWTIERMSILWEEEGPKAVATQGGGSLLTAVIIYCVMTNHQVQHLTFNFIGLQLILLAFILLLGSYTGYRITELKRFKPFTET